MSETSGWRHRKSRLNATLHKVMTTCRPLQAALARWGAAVVFIALTSCCKADRYAVLIGINAYADAGIQSLNGAAADARSIAKTLVEVDGFSKDHVHLLVGERRENGIADPDLPTADNIGGQLEWLKSVVKPGDTVFFFFAGHGLQYGGQAWLLPYDVNVHGDFVFEHSALSAERIRSYLDALPCLLVAAYDMCRRPPGPWPASTARGLGFGFRLGQLQERSIATVHPAKSDHPFVGGSVAIFACQRGQFSWESHELGRGFFSKCLENALSYSSAPKGDLTIHDMVENLRENVLSSVGAYGLSEDQEPDALPSSDAVYRRVFATGLRQRPGSRTVVAGSPKPAASDLTSRGGEDAYLDSFQAGFHLYKRKRYREAQMEFENTLRIKRTAAVLRILGDCHYYQKDKEGARRFFNEALAVDPKYSPAYSDLGAMADLDAKNFNESMAYYDKAIACDPDNPAPVNNLARVFHEMHKPADCLAMYRKAVDLDPNNGLYEANLALELLNQHADDAAVEHARRAKALGLENHPVFKRLSMQP